MLVAMRELVAVVVVAITTGCGFESGGTASEDYFFDAARIDDVASADTRVDEPDTAIEPVDSFVPDTAPTDTAPVCDTTACGALPMATVKRVALVDRGVACPAGFTSTDVVEGTAGDGCACACTLGAPACPGAGAIPTFYSADTSCGTTGTSINSVGSGTCSTVGGGGGSLSTYFKATAPAATGGSCVAVPTNNPSAVARQRKLCEPNSGTCVAPICGSPYLECIEVAGTCPAQFPNRQTIGTSVSVTGCPACTCTLTRGSCTGNISFYGTSCTGTPTTLPVDGTCALVPAGSGTIFSFKYTPNAVTGASCAPSYPTAPGTRTFAGQRNLCCK
jgi:hypothetical protein